MRNPWYLTGNERWRIGMANAIGRHWLLLRGLSREAAHWGEFLPLLQSRFPDARISTLDLPGTGNRYREASPCRIPEIVESIRKSAIEEGLLHQPVTLVALSLGGMVAWEWMLRHPEEVCAAVLINTSYAGLSPFYQRLRWQAYPAMIRAILEANLSRRESAIIRSVANRHDREALLSEWVNIQSKRPVSKANTLRQIMAASRYGAGFEKPIQPVLLLSGRGDRLVAPACSDAIHIKWQIPMESHPWAGHDLPLDDRVWVANHLQDWAERLKNQ